MNSNSSFVIEDDDVSYVIVVILCRLFLMALLSWAKEGDDRGYVRSFVLAQMREQCQVGQALKRKIMG